MSKSSRRWLSTHHQDEYVQRARLQGYRSRAVYKLQQLDEKYKLFRPGMRVVDLGAAPGGWSQYAVHKVGMRGYVIATDILKMDAIAGVDFIQGDFCEEAVEQEILARLQNQPAELVISDMAPNISGMQAVDIPRSLHLIELARDFAAKVLCAEGVFLCKVFQGAGSDTYIRDLRRQYTKISIKKPKASRAGSREVYVLAQGFRRQAAAGSETC